jgi:hypothetical protein
VHRFHRGGMAERCPLILHYHYWFTHNSILSMLAAASRRAENTSTLYIIRMSRKAFFPLGGHFVENSLTGCEPCRSWRRANGSRESLWRGEVEGRGGDASGLAGETPALLWLRGLRPHASLPLLVYTYSILSLLARL